MFSNSRNYIELRIMPYISQENRDAIDSGSVPMHSGELNYLFTCICNDYLRQYGLSYQRVNDLIGALEGAKLELYRRIASPYEDKKMVENGDVYSTQTATRNTPQELRRQGVEL
jgi:hypothetical protein